MCIETSGGRPGTLQNSKNRCLTPVSLYSLHVDCLQGIQGYGAEKNTLGSKKEAEDTFPCEQRLGLGQAGRGEQPFQEGRWIRFKVSKPSGKEAGDNVLLPPQIGWPVKFGIELVLTRETAAAACAYKKITRSSLRQDRSAGESWQRPMENPPHHPDAIVSSVWV